MVLLSKAALKSGLEAALIPIGFYLSLAPAITTFGFFRGLVADRGHAGGEAVGLTFMADVFNVIPTIYLLVSFWFLIQIKQRNVVSLTLHGLLFILSLDC